MPNYPGSIQREISHGDTFSDPNLTPEQNVERSKAWAETAKFGWQPSRIEQMITILRLRGQLDDEDFDNIIEILEEIK